MSTFLPTIILRHRKENLKKCSLRGLEGREDILFFRYPDQMGKLPSFEQYILLDLEAPPLSTSDASSPLLLIDGTWKYAKKMVENLPSDALLIRRSLPPQYKTAYPRKQTDCDKPEQGLASVEALYLAYHLVGKETDGLLDHYYWKDGFLKINNL